MYDTFAGFSTNELAAALPASLANLDAGFEGAEERVIELARGLSERMNESSGKVYRGTEGGPWGDGPRE